MPTKKEVEKSEECASMSITEEEYEKHTTEAWLSGKVAGVDEVLCLLVRRSGECFAARRDEEAKRLRELVDMLKKDVSVPMLKALEAHKENG